MIETLRIQDLAIVERVDVEFGPELNVLTGETGAGKSIVLGALALLAGGRASAESVRDGAAEAVVEAVFRTDRLPELEAELAARGLEPEDHSLVVSRTVSRSGRSRAQVAGRLVPIGTLAELFAGRLEISSQHESQGLRRPETHARLLDAFGDTTELRREVEALVAALREARAERERLEAEADERARRQDFLAFQVGEIDEAAIEPDEFATLGSEHARLVHAEELRSEVGAASAALAGDDTGSSGEPGGACDRLEDAASRVERGAALDPELAPLAERLRAAQSDLLDAARDLERYAQRVDVDPARLAGVEERLAVLERLRRKYGRSEDEIAEQRGRLAAELADIDTYGERERDLEAREAADLARLEAAAGALSRGRAKAAKRLARAVRAGLADLDMKDARLEVALEPIAPPDGLPCAAAGAEHVELRLAANPGEAPRPLHRIASGGELSRVFLAVKNVLRRTESGMVLVFDEVDAGVGGRAADRVGAGLAALAEDHQVLCITHLPQIAAAGSTHLRVSKTTGRGRTTTEVCLLPARERVEELARMAGGETVTDATRRHARQLLRAREADRRQPAPPTAPSR